MKSIAMFFVGVFAIWFTGCNSAPSHFEVEVLEGAEGKKVLKRKAKPAPDTSERFEVVVLAKKSAAPAPKKKANQSALYVQAEQYLKNLELVDAALQAQMKMATISPDAQKFLDGLQLSHDIRIEQFEEMGASPEVLDGIREEFNVFLQGVRVKLKAWHVDKRLAPLYLNEKVAIEKIAEYSDWIEFRKSQGDYIDTVKTLQQRKWQWEKEGREVRRRIDNYLKALENQQAVNNQAIQNTKVFMETLDK